MTTVPTDDRPAQLEPPETRAAPPEMAREEARPAGRAPFLRGARFPVAVFVGWRLYQLAALLRQNGSGVYTAFNYDGEHYLRILHYGYWNPRPVMPSHAFFPGIPWLATPVYWLTGSDAIAVHVTVTLTGLAAFVAVWGAAKAWKDERVARLAVVLLALFPASLFLWAFYSEGLFIALGAGAIWADRRGRHGIATACLVAIGTTRSIGVVVPAVLVLARIIRQRRVDRWAVTYAIAGVVGLSLVLLTMWHHVGDPFAWAKVQDDWGRELSWPWSSVAQGFANLDPDPSTVMVPALVARNLDLWCVPIVLAAIAYAAFSRRDRFPMEAWMLGVAMIALPLCSSVLASFNRFVLADWVIYPVYASIGYRLPGWLRWPLLALLAGVALWTNWVLIGRFAVNRFVG